MIIESGGSRGEAVRNSAREYEIGSQLSDQFVKMSKWFRMVVVKVPDCCL